MKTRHFSRKILVYIFMAPVLLSLSGCIYLVVGGIGAVGGYIVSPDTVEGISENETGVVWDAAVEVASIMGLITEQSEAGGIILASVSAAKVTITVSSLSPTKTKVTVKARKAYLPRISLAQDVFVKIMNRLEE